MLPQHGCSQQVEMIIHLYLMLVRPYLEHRVQLWAFLVLKKPLTNCFSTYLHLDSWTLPKDTVLFLCGLKTTALITAEKAFKAWYLLSFYSHLTLLQVKTHGYF